VSEQLPAPLQVVCRVAGVSRSAACERRRRRGTSESPRRRPGPVGAMSDPELLAQIRDVSPPAPFVGEGHRKVWARLARRGVCTSRKRVLRLTREAGLLADGEGQKTRQAPPRRHDHRAAKPCAGEGALSLAAGQGTPQGLTGTGRPQAG